MTVLIKNCVTVFYAHIITGEIRYDILYKPDI